MDDQSRIVCTYLWGWGIRLQPMKGIKTGIGRARAFLRLALMQKKLPDYLDLLQSSDQSFRATFWEDWSLIRNDEAPEIFGHMQGLSIGTVLFLRTSLVRPG